MDIYTNTNSCVDTDKSDIAVGEDFGHDVDIYEGIDIN